MTDEQKMQQEMSRQDMPYEKFERFGPSHLTEAELLAIILRTGTKDKSAVALGEAVLALPVYPQRGLLGLHHVSLEKLMQIKGIGRVKAVKMKCLAELCKRMAQADAGERLVFQSSKTVADYYMERLRHETTEQVLMLLLDSKGQLIEEMVLSKGTVKTALISPREVFIGALKAEAVNVILLHNHPSGDPTPSAADAEITEVVKRAGKLLDILLLDHIIIGDKKYLSFKEQGLL